MAVFVLYAVHQLGLTQAEVGLRYGLGSVGGIAAALLAGRAAARLGLGRVLFVGTAIGAVGQLLIPLAPHAASAFFMLAAALAFGGFGGTVYNINQVSLRQAITAQELLGRMNASMRFIVWGPMPLGSLVGGVLGTAVGLHDTLWVGAGGGLLAVLWTLRRPVRKLSGVAEAAQAYCGAAGASSSS